MWQLRFDHPSTGPDADLGRARLTESFTRFRPAWLDLTLARRLSALALAVLAAVLALRGDPAAHRRSVVVAARELTPGRILTADDLRRTDLPAAVVPAGAVTDPAQLVGATSTGAVHAGEILTDLRVVSPRLAAAATGAADARIVPMRLADNAVTAILRPGDRVDVVAADDPPADTDTDTDTHQRRAPVARTLAGDAAVVLVSGTAATGTARAPAASERIVLLALDPDHAATVAAASLRTALTVVFH
ncbi:putative Flp pilus assembly protein CpaB [Nocardia nova SH22a]|uniref:Putative Flp pilus assembly protein CpaB n=1 Tax=Nocardia nova SH22a TaxID=1415166 RepID=W5TQX8_9NOCA|nr:Flp pilus assembly protein CpaB [Nocardia nova]AHH21539.1 putative Flp pilus assembly protein CpaB [Nocardia nova SH22a]